MWFSKPKTSKNNESRASLCPMPAITAHRPAGSACTNSSAGLKKSSSHGLKNGPTRKASPFFSVFMPAASSSAEKGFVKPVLMVGSF